MQNIIDLAASCEGSEAKVTLCKQDYQEAQAAGLNLGGKVISQGSAYEVCAGRLFDEVQKHLNQTTPAETSEEKPESENQEKKTGEGEETVVDDDSLESLEISAPILKKLEANGITTVTQFTAVIDFSALDGIGPKTASQLDDLRASISDEE